MILRCSINMDSVQQIKLWVLDHACKHGMEPVIRLVLKDPNVTALFLNSVENTVLNVNPTFLFTLLVRNLIDSLRSAKSDEDNEHTSWNQDLLSLVTELLMSTYEQDRFISATHFQHLITQLKLMELMRCFSENMPNPEIVKRLNVLLPRWDHDYEAKFQKQFGIDKNTLNKLKPRLDKYRKFILQLTVNPDFNRNYRQHCLENDVIGYIDKAIIYLKKILKSIESKVGMSLIEKVMREAANDENYSSDPSVQMILEYIKPDMKEVDFINLLNSFEVESQFMIQDSLMDIMGSQIDLDTLTDAMDDQLGSLPQPVEHNSAVELNEEATPSLSLNVLAGPSMPFKCADDEMEIADSEDEIISSDSNAPSEVFPFLQT